MKIIKSEPNPSGAYPPVQTWGGDTPPEGYREITADTTEFFNGFIVPTATDGIVTAFTENAAAHKAWKDAEAAKPEPVIIPTTEERVAALEDAACEADAANDARMTEIENALCELDGGKSNG